MDANMLPCQFCEKSFKNVKSCLPRIHMCERAKEAFWKPRSLEVVSPFPSIASKNTINNRISQLLRHSEQLQTTIATKGDVITV
jgi:hypothetical protein